MTVIDLFLSWLCFIPSAISDSFSCTMNLTLFMISVDSIFTCMKEPGRIGDCSTRDVVVQFQTQEDRDNWFWRHSNILVC